MSSTTELFWVTVSEYQTVAPKLEPSHAVSGSPPWVVAPAVEMLVTATEPNAWALANMSFAGERLMFSSSVPVWGGRVGLS